MFALSDARDYSFSKVPYLEREEMTDQSNFVKKRDVISLQVPAARGSHFVENGYLTLRFPNMVKVNIHEH